MYNSSRIYPPNPNRTLSGPSQQLPPPYDQQQQQQQQQQAGSQNVINQQPASARLSGAPGECLGSIERPENSTTLPYLHQQHVMHQQQPSSSHRQVLNFFASNQQQANSFASFQQQLQQQFQHPPQAFFSATNTIASSNLKSKSCLTCSDISIKWYIVVIALLGLICALIGTIVGAVHSVGRDYISLALLLVGVGLVLVAISWVALRITIKTYHKNSPCAGQRTQQHQQQPTRTLLSLPPPHRQAASRIYQNQQQQSASTGNLQRTLLNERLYMMAACAAAGSSSGRGAPAGPQHAAGGQPSTSRSGSQDSMDQQPGGSGLGNPAGLMSGIKQRLPRRLARLMPSQAARDSAAAGAHEPALGFGPASSQAAAAAAAATALLHQYQAAALLAPPGHHQAAAAAAAAILLQHQHPPPHFMNPLLADFANFRPPPPSYSATMQDQRLRMLMQERFGLQQQSSALASLAGQCAAPPAPQQPQQNCASIQAQNRAPGGQNSGPQQQQQPQPLNQEREPPQRRTPSQAPEVCGGQGPSAMGPTDSTGGAGSPPNKLTILIENGSKSSRSEARARQTNSPNASISLERAEAKATVAAPSNQLSVKAGQVAREALGGGTQVACADGRLGPLKTSLSAPSLAAVDAPTNNGKMVNNDIYISSSPNRARAGPAGSQNSVGPTSSSNLHSSSSSSLCLAPGSTEAGNFLGSAKSALPTEASARNSCRPPGREQSLANNHTIVNINVPGADAQCSKDQQRERRKSGVKILGYL